MSEVYGDYLYISGIIPQTDIPFSVTFNHCQLSFSSETLKNQSTTQSGHADVTIIRKDKLNVSISFRGFPDDVSKCYDLSLNDTVTLSFFNPTRGIREERECIMDGLTYSRVEKSENLDYIAHNMGLYDISFTLEEV